MKELDQRVMGDISHKGQASLAASIALVLLFFGCVEGPEDVILPPADDYKAKIDEAWMEFGSGHYEDAIVTFREASEIDPAHPGAYLGMGWGYAMIDGMEDSLFNFGLAIGKGPSSPDGYAAEAFVHLAQNSYEDAIAMAEGAISLGGEDYVFEHIPDVRTRNLRLVMAESYYATGQYADAQAQVDILNPDNGLDPSSYTYKQDLLLEIERLGPVGQIMEELYLVTLDG